MRINDRDHINHTELVRLLGITAWAAFRRGELSARDQRRCERILAQAEKRESAKKR
ncbi:hypothetical protein ACFY2W_36130 [Streptomyces sp. NPDC001262]|uniref:hypothetical protein n=1 Tax=Streptomyces sp. NPDC001262 TaxID=3364552 RepID=UPI0036B4EBC0